jgi:hypothetical protein
MHSLKRFFAMLFLCGLLVPSCYARQDGPPDPDATAPSTQASSASAPTTSAPSSDDSGPSAAAESGAVEL